MPSKRQLQERIKHLLDRNALLRQALCDAMERIRELEREHGEETGN